MPNNKKFFIENEILNFTMVSSLTRGCPVYKSGIDDREREKFRCYLKEKLQKMFPEYRGKVTGERHIVNIRRFKEGVDALWGFILSGGQLRFGRAQKLVNVYLKYKWTLGDTDFAPPHCPFDSTVILDLGGRCNWTEMGEEDYRRLVEIAAQKWGKENLSARELNLFNEKNY